MERVHFGFRGATGGGVLGIWGLRVDTPDLNCFTTSGEGSCETDGQVSSPRTSAATSERLVYNAAVFRVFCVVCDASRLIPLVMSVIDDASDTGEESDDLLETFSPLFCEATGE